MKSLSIILIFVCLSLTLNAQNETLSVAVAGDTVTIFNYGAHENCVARFAIILQTNGYLVTLIEDDTVKQKAFCICNFDLSASASGFPIGKYGVMVYRKYQMKYNYPADTLVFIGSASFIITSAGGTPQFLTTKQSECYQTTNIGSDIVRPNEIDLEAYPNPSASGDFILKYSLTRPEHVILRIFNSIGKEISTLIDAEKPAGKYEFLFQKNASILSGIYYCTLITETANKTVRIVIEK